MYWEGCIRLKNEEKKENEITRRRLDLTTLTIRGQVVHGQLTVYNWSVTQNIDSLRERVTFETMTNNFHFKTINIFLVFSFFTVWCTVEVFLCHYGGLTKNTQMERRVGFFLFFLFFEMFDYLV